MNNPCLSDCIKKDGHAPGCPNAPVPVGKGANEMLCDAIDCEHEWACGDVRNITAALMAKNSELNRRASVAEGAVLKAAKEGRPNLGRALANAACGPLRRENEALRAEVDRLREIITADICDNAIECARACSTEEQGRHAEARAILAARKGESK